LLADGRAALAFPQAAPEVAPHPLALSSLALVHPPAHAHPPAKQSVYHKHRK